MTNPSLLTEYTAEIDDLSITLYIPNIESEMIASDNTSPFLHTHFYIEIFVCTSGELGLLFKDRTVKLYPGDIAVIPSEFSHSAATHDTKHFFTLGMIGTQRKEKGVRNTYRAFFDIFNIDRVRIFRGASEISKNLYKLINKNVVDQRFSAIRFAALLSELSELTSFESFGSPTTGARINQNEDKSRFIAIEDIIYTHYAQNIDVDEIAKRLFISRRHFDRIVCEKYGKTFYELIYETRVKVAEGLLLSTDESVEKIALHVGFSSAASLKRHFVRIIGETPSEYRKNRRALK
jgi:AraC-like DNA-binding protein/mannose-6-phosphate isomerase-like protein (cupin superfamily)